MDHMLFERNLPVDEAHPAVNVAAVKRTYLSYQESGFEIEAMITEIKGFLCGFAADGSLDSWQTQKISNLQLNLKE